MNSQAKIILIKNITKAKVLSCRLRIILKKQLLKNKIKKQLLWTS